MPWARIPPDKLINLPLFGIDVVADDGDFVWMSGPSGRMHVSKRAPRVYFEDIADAHQAGAAAILITSDADRERHSEITKTREDIAADGIDDVEPASDVTGRDI